MCARRWAESSDARAADIGNGISATSKHSLPFEVPRGVPRQKELQPLHPSSLNEGHRGNQGQRGEGREGRESKHLNAWASPRSSGSNPSESTKSPENLPEAICSGIHLQFLSQTGSTDNVVWCPLTQMWHCRVGAELVISILPGTADLPSSGQRMPHQNVATIPGLFTLSWSSQAGSCSEQAPLSMERNAFNAFSSTWIARNCGQTDFHAKWIDEQKAQHSLQGNIRVFANAGSLCVHPNWQDADPSCTELVDVQAELFGSAWLVRCQLQLREATGRNLQCPGRVSPVESTGPSFGGVGPDTRRWKPSVPGFASTVSKLDAGSRSASVTLLDRDTCVRTKASPHTLDLWLPDLPVSEASDRAQAHAIHAIHPIHAIQVLPCLKSSLEAKTGGEAPLAAKAPASASDAISDSPPPLTSSSSTDSPKKRQLLMALQKGVETRHQTPQQEAGPSHAGSPLSNAPGATGRFLEPVPLEGKLSPKASLPRECPSNSEDAKKLSKESRTIQNVSTLLQHAGPSASTNSWQSQTLCDNTSPRRYMPSEPLPNYGGWSRKKKSKSRSPSKKQRDFAKNYW
eukprot:Skav216895  [mRNA]  locus=scaffold1276:171832:173725:+ [translate_table: standard]